MPVTKKRQLNSNFTVDRNIKIGNLLYSILCKNGAGMDSLENFYTAEDCSRRPADCRIEVIDHKSRANNDRAQIRSNKLFEADQTWGIYRGKKAGINGGTIMTVPALKKGSRSRVFAEFDCDFRNGTVYTGRAEEHYFFYPFLEVLTINLLARGKGSLLHACCIDDNGAGYLFLGQSGAGKSTMANLWNEEEGITVLSDDRVLVSTTAKGITAHGTPWHGTEKYAVNASVPVNKIFFINHAEKNSVLKLSGIKAASELIKNAFLPFWDKNRMEYSTEFLVQLSQKARLFSLGVYPDRGIIDLVRNI